MSQGCHKYEEFLGKQDLDGCRFWPFFFCGHHIESVFLKFFFPFLRFDQLYIFSATSIEDSKTDGMG